MAEFKFDLSINPVKLAPDIVRVLEEAGVPCVLVDSMMLSIMGVRGFVTQISMAVPDEQFETAYETLLAAGFPRCEHNWLNCDLYPDFAPAASGHFHPWWGRKHGMNFYLFKKSEIYWSFPDFKLGVPPEDDPYYIASTDPRIPLTDDEFGWFAGRYPPESYPMKIPLPIRAIEAGILWECRDFREDGWRNNCNGERWVYDIMRFVEDRDLFKVGEPQEPFATMSKLFEKNSIGNIETIYKALRELREKLLSEGTLPPPGPQQSLPLPGPKSHDEEINDALLRAL